MCQKQNKNPVLPPNKSVPYTDDGETEADHGPMRSTLSMEMSAYTMDVEVTVYSGKLPSSSPTSSCICDSFNLLFTSTRFTLPLGDWRKEKKIYLRV